jgi:RHS repeat-associated protein
LPAGRAAAPGDAGRLPDERVDLRYPGAIWADRTYPWIPYALDSDHLGSTSLATDANSAVVPNSRKLYDAWGNVRVRGDLKTDIGYTSQREDRSTNLMFYRTRYYSPGITRFISADTIVPEPQNPQSLNRFSYGLNNPVKYTDPSGHAVDAGGASCSDCW